MKRLGLWLLCCLHGVLYAQSLPIEGYWLNRDHQTNRPLSVMHLTVQEGKLVGRVVAAFYLQNEPLPDRFCQLCSKKTQDGIYGLGKHKPILGSYLMWDFSHKTDQHWQNGRLLRLKNGGIYRANITLSDTDQLLINVHWGFWSKELTWTRLTFEQMQLLCSGELSMVSSNENLRILCVAEENT